MELALSQEQSELAGMVRSLLAKRADPGAVRAAIDSEAGYDTALWQTMVQQIGVAALAVPEEYDGAGFSLFESLVVLEELGRSLAPSPLLSSLLVGEALLAGCGADSDSEGDSDADEALARLLPRVAAGEPVAFADARRGGRVVVLDGAGAAVLVVAGERGLYEVDPAAVTLEPAEAMDPTLRFASLDVDALAGLAEGVRVIGDADAAARAAARVALVGAVAAAALATGLMERALEMTVTYTGQRRQFGRPIGSFQALKHRMADMLVLTEMSRSISWTASYAVSAGTEDAERRAHVAKAYCCDAAMSVAGETVQLHGGIAITWEHDAHLILKRAHALAQLFGQPHEHRALVALD